MAARKIAGLELMTVDSSPMTIASLEPEHDGRRASARVAGPAALLVARAFKIEDRLRSARQDRLVDKDAGDVVRIMLAVPASEVATTLAQVFDDPVVGETAQTGLRYLHGQFGRRRSPGVVMAVRALTGSLPDTTIEKVTVAYVDEVERTAAGEPQAERRRDGK